MLLERFYTAKAHDKNIIYIKNEGYLTQMGFYLLLAYICLPLRISSTIL